MNKTQLNFRRKAISAAVHCSLTLAFVTTAKAQEEQAEQQAGIERIEVTANKQPQDLQEVSSSLTALSASDIERAGIIDITGLENLTPGLRIGSSGGEVRPAMRGARTNEVGVAGTGIAEQVVGIFQDGVYVPTTTAGLGAYSDVQRIEVLRGPQGTLYGRNTFAGSINVISKEPELEYTSGSIKATHGSYNRSAYETVLNLPVSDEVATRFVVSADRHDGMIENHVVPGPSDDLREKNQFYARNITKYDTDDFKAMLRIDYSKKDSNSEAIWGYQQIAGYQITETSPGSGIFDEQATVTPGHIYQPGDAQRDDKGPYDVYRNAMSLDKQESWSATATLEWALDIANVKWTTNYSELSGQQFYDSDYSDGGLDIVGGFGRQDDQQAISTELQLSSVENNGPFSWIAGAYLFSQEADWEWLWREDTTGDGIADDLVVPSWGNPDHDPHKVDSLALFGQARYQLTDTTGVLAGLRYNKDEKTFTGDSIPDWDDSAVLWKLAVEHNLAEDIMLYASAATGYRTGGANDTRVVARGADPLYDNEDVISYELGMKSYLFDNAVRLNLSVFANEYSDVKAQLFAVSCNDINAGLSVVQCVNQGVSTTFEYYENGGDVSTYGLEADLQWRPTHALTINSTLSLLDSEFSNDYAVGNSDLRPLLGLGNFQGRQDINDPNSQFSFKGWSPAMSPGYTFGLSGRYEIELDEGLLTPYLQLTFVDDYYAFDTNIPEAKVDAHIMANARISWEINDNIQLDVFANNLTDEAVLTRAVVHSQIVDGLPINSVQANWNNPRTFGISLKYSFF
ncbi:TonB-dependent receptor [Lacimicrobium alkaliphilum]|uniref:TonB-dependent receptor n=1 Tax=Lacimicrobium alkaliphilum TaxID=1526571 RepID=A0ABQ1R8H9_9ALTE|nr:TonB-dependent receptor [Lacimicrobium alkaliphilum]GGD58475.1 TonB-dependent receptor [Lacimicrobium alkaliphilum]